MRPFACAGRDSERTKPTHGPQVYHAAAYLCCASSCVHAHVCERNRAPSLLPPNPLRDASRQKKGVGKQEERGSLYLLFRKKLVLRAMYPKQRKDGEKKIHERTARSRRLSVLIAATNATPRSGRAITAAVPSSCNL